MITIGVDPDTEATGVVVLVWRDDGTYDSAKFDISSLDVPGEDASTRNRQMAKRLVQEFRRMRRDYQKHTEVVVAIERQAARSGDPRPDDIVQLNAVFGMAMAAAASELPHATIFDPLPVQWKGSIPKKAHQERLLRNHPSIVPLLYPFLKTRQSELVDALGLAVWAREESRKKVSRMRLRAEDKT